MIDEVHNTGRSSGTTVYFRLTSALLASVLWGCWAYYANGEFALSIRLVAGVTQGVASFSITLLIVQGITWLFNALPKNGSRLMLPPLVMIAILGSGIALAHVIAGTPNVMLTILPPLMIGFAFSIVTVSKLSKASRAATSSAAMERP